MSMPRGSFAIRGFIAVSMALAAFLFVAEPGEAYAATKTWSGTGNMSTATNWDGNTLPADGDTILFNGTSTADATWDSTFASSYSNLVVNVASGYSGTITLGADATIASSTIAAGTFNTAARTLTANGTMTIAGGVVTSTYAQGVHVFNADLQANSGTFTPAYTTTIKGSWRVVSASVTLDETNSFTITFASTTGSQYFKPGSGVSYCGITVNNTAGGSSDSVILETDTLTSYCAVTVTQGLFDFATNNIAWTHGSSLTVANNAEAGLAFGTPTYSFQGNIELGSSSSVSSVSTTYVYEPQDAGTYYVTSTSNQVFNGTFTLTLSCGSASTMVVSGGLATTHLKVTKGIADFRTKNATLDADGTITVDSSQVGSCTPGTQLGLTWGTGQFNVGGNFYQLIANSSITVGDNNFIFDGSGDQVVSTTAQFYNVHVRKPSGTIYPGTSANGTSNVMLFWNVVDMTVATGTIRFDQFDDGLLVAGDFLVSGASTSITLSNGTGAQFNGNVLMTAAGTITGGTATTSISTSTSGALQAVGASAGTMDLGKIAVSSSMIIPASYSLNVQRPSVTTTLGYIRIDGGTFTISSTDSTKIISAAANQYRFASTSTIKLTGSGTFPSGSVFSNNVTLSSSGQTFTITASTTVMGTLTIASGTTLVVNDGIDFTVPAVGSIVNNGTLTETGTIIHPNSHLRFVDSAGTQKTTVTYQAGGLLYVEVKDEDGNLNGASTESMTTASNQIRLYSNTGDSESVQMTETATASGVFRGSITVRGTNVASREDGALDMTGNGTLTLAYVDVTDATDAATTTVSVLSEGSTGSSSGASGASSLTGTVLINAGALTTESPVVMLQLSATGATEMAISEREDFSGGVWAPYATSTTFTFNNTLGTKTVYVKFANSTGLISPVATDTIQLVQTVSGGTPALPGVPTSPSLPSEPAPGVVIPFGLSVGNLVKIQGNSAVYYIDATGTRRAFPSETVYRSWYGTDFSLVKTITAEQLATFTLGKNMTIKPGSYLVKITTVPKVYAVTGDATLQWVSTETRAIELFGADWAKKVVDVPDAYFVNYTILPTAL